MLRRELPAAARALAINDNDLTRCIACGRIGASWRPLTPIDLGGGHGRASVCVDFRDCNKAQPVVTV